ncbi:MAG: NADH-quinone oxidoreductase subunit N [Elusimicrobiota bacterium]|nr:NADH-quinone oxidoreductase subunit N [Elusimicrobiota bacterium]
MSNLILLNPEIILACAGLLILLAGAFIGESRAKLLFHLGTISAAAVLGMVITQAVMAAYGMGTMWVLDPAAQLFKFIILAATVFTLLLSVNYTAIQPRHVGTYTALVLWASCGMMFLSGAMDFIYLLISLELISICCFILTGFEQKNPRSAEGAIKYFLMGGLSTAVTIYGISLFYGATGTTNLFNYVSSVDLHFSDPAYIMGMLFILVGFGFKISMVPFHFWAPDAYEGAPTPITAYLSVASKLAALGAMMRIFASVIPHYAIGSTMLIAVLAALTMTLGNLTALFQTNIKRLLAYSSIAQAGYMLIGLVVADPLGRESVLFYALAYLVTNMGAFAVAMVVAGKTGSYELEAYDGLAKRSLGLSIVMVMFLLSLAGIPPLVGFIGKFYLFASAVNSQTFLWLAVVGVLNSVVSVYYYMNIARRMFFAEGKDTSLVETDIYTTGVIVITSAATLLMGILPETCMRVVKNCVSFHI